MNTTTSGRAWTGLVLGVLIFLVPFVTGATGANGYNGFAYSDYATGVVVFVLSAVSIWAARNNLRVLAWLEGVNTLAGLWAIITPFVYVNNTNALYANVILGLVLVVVAAWDSYVGMTNARGTTMTRRGRAT